MSEWQDIAASAIIAAVVAIGAGYSIGYQRGVRDTLRRRHSPDKSEVR